MNDPRGRTKTSRGWSGVWRLPALLLAWLAVSMSRLSTPTSDNKNVRTVEAEGMTSAASAAGEAGKFAGNKLPTSGDSVVGSPDAPLNDAYLELRPGTGAPPNGGTANVGDRFVLELWVNGGDHTDVVGQQSYISFTHSLLQNVRVSSIGTSCVLTGTVTGDF